MPPIPRLLLQGKEGKSSKAARQLDDRSLSGAGGGGGGGGATAEERERLLQVRATEWGLGSEEGRPTFLPC